VAHCAASASGEVKIGLGVVGSDGDHRQASDADDAVGARRARHRRWLRVEVAQKRRQPALNPPRAVVRVLASAGADLEHGTPVQPHRRHRSVLGIGPRGRNEEHGPEKNEQEDRAAPHARRRGDQKISASSPITTRSPIRKMMPMTLPKNLRMPSISPTRCLVDLPLGTEPWCRCGQNPSANRAVPHLQAQGQHTHGQEHRGEGSFLTVS
jgi:hypothetical protein